MSAAVSRGLHSFFPGDDLGPELSIPPTASYGAFQSNTNSRLASRRRAGDHDAVQLSLDRDRIGDGLRRSSRRAGRGESGEGFQRVRSKRTSGLRASEPARDPCGRSKAAAPDGQGATGGRAPRSKIQSVGWVDGRDRCGASRLDGWSRAGAALSWEVARIGESGRPRCRGGGRTARGGAARSRGKS